MQLCLELCCSGHSSSNWEPSKEHTSLKGSQQFPRIKLRERLIHPPETVYAFWEVVLDSRATRLERVALQVLATAWPRPNMIDPIVVKLLSHKNHYHCQQASRCLAPVSCQVTPSSTQRHCNLSNGDHERGLTFLKISRAISIHTFKILLPSIAHYPNASNILVSAANMRRRAWC